MGEICCYNSEIFVTYSNCGFYTEACIRFDICTILKSLPVVMVRKMQFLF